jgi:kynurenine formamidase
MGTIVQGALHAVMRALLDQVPATGALIVVAWPKPKGGLGFPVRAFAILP